MLEAWEFLVSWAPNTVTEAYRLFVAAPKRVNTLHAHAGGPKACLLGDLTVLLSAESPRFIGLNTAARHCQGATAKISCLPLEIEQVTK